MADEVKAAEVVEEQVADVEAAVDAVEEAAEPAKKKSKKLPIIGGILAVVVVAAIGFWVWHNTPGFCANPICHVSMDPYLATFSAQENAPTTDKWGVEVSNSNAMIAVSHRVAGKACLDCHIPSFGQQVHEVVLTVTGDYTVPLEEVDVLGLMTNSSHPSASGLGDEFCLNEGCHNMTRIELARSTADMEFNPHAPGVDHKTFMCSDCHKSHRASVLACTDCHEEAYASMPDGWVDAKTGREIAKSIYA